MCKHGKHGHGPVRGCCEQRHHALKGHDKPHALWRRFETKEEKREVLENYKEELERELEAVKEKLEKI